MKWIKNPLERNHPRTLISLLMLPALALVTSACFAATIDGPGLNWPQLVQGLFFGLVIFLFGMGLMGEAMKSAVGDQMKTLLHRLTTNRIKGLLTGLGVTAIIQSSSVTTVMLVSFVSVGLMSFARTIPAILGADVGTTITAQIVAFKITHLAPMICVFGFGLYLAQRTRDLGQAFFGLGLLLYGMSLMGDAMKPLRTYQPFMDMMVNMDGPLFGILVAACFTALVQSSSAAIGVIIALASQGLITLETGIALALGANIGTCVTAGLAAIGKSRAAVRVAVAHVLIKVLGVAIILPFVPAFAELIVKISPQAGAGMATVNTMSEVVPRQVANAHTVFNVGIALIFLPFTGWLANFIERLIPERQRSDTEVAIQAISLPETLIRTSPGMAIEAVRREVCRIGELIKDDMQKDIGNAMISGDEQKLQRIVERDHDVNRLYRNLVSIIPRISQEKLSADESRQIGLLWELADLVEIMGDSIKELAASRRHRIFKEYRVSEQTRSRFIEFDGAVNEILNKALQAIAEVGVNREQSVQFAQEVIVYKKKINQLADDFKFYLQEKRLHEERSSESGLSQDRIRLYAVETDLIARMRSSANYPRKVAKAVLDSLSQPEIAGEDLVDAVTLDDGDAFVRNAG